MIKDKMSKKLAVGIDIGGTLTKVGFVDTEGELYAHLDFPTQGYPDVDDYMSVLASKIQYLERQLSFDYEMVGLGIGAPNANYYRGTIEYAANLEWKGIIPFVSKVKAHFNVPIYMTNDANAAAIGEVVYGDAKKMRDFIVITLGTGLGSGIYANGALIYGHDAMAGELGHISIDRDGRLDGLGVKGGLEAYVSSTGLKRTIFELLSDSISDSELRNYSFNNLHGEGITRAAEHGDEIACAAFEMTGKILGEQLANFVAFSHPEAIFLLGGLAKSGKWIFEPTQRHLEANLLPYYKGKVKLLPSGMIDKNAAILGAAALVWNQQDP
jgi:glucokinase